MARIRVDLRVPVGRPLPDVAAFIARCEEAGFDGVGIHDHPSSGRDAYDSRNFPARGSEARASLAQPKVLSPSSLLRVPL